MIGDVVGHDTAAAGARGQVRGLLRGIAYTTGDGPAVVLRIEQTLEERERGLTRLLPDAPTDDLALVAVRLHLQDQPRPAEAGPRVLPPGVPAKPDTA